MLTGVDEGELEIPLVPSAVFCSFSAMRRERSLRPGRPVFSSSVFGLTFLGLRAFFLGLNESLSEGSLKIGSLLGVVKFGFCSVLRRAERSTKGVVVPCSLPEAERLALYFSACSMVSLISASISARGRAYFLREDSMMEAKLSVVGFGMFRVVAEKAGTFSPLIIIEMTKCRLLSWRRSAASKVGSNCLTRMGASSAETRKEMVVPTLPKTASRTASVI